MSGNRIHTFKFLDTSNQQLLVHEVERQLLSDGERLFGKLIQKLNGHLVCIVWLCRCTEHQETSRT